jgi:hypothetical protein
MCIATAAHDHGAGFLKHDGRDPTTLQGTLRFTARSGYRVHKCRTMAQQPPEDVGATQLLLVVAVVLVVLVTGVIVLMYDRPPARELGLTRVLTFTCVGEFASGISSSSCPAP